MDDRVLGTIILALFVLVGNLFKKGGWLERMRGGSASSQPPPIPPAAAGSPSSPDAQMRRLLEALGRPTTDSPPPLPPPAPGNRPPVLTARPPPAGDLAPPFKPKTKKQRKREREDARREAAAAARQSRPPVPSLPATSVVVERAPREIATLAPSLFSQTSLTQQRATSSPSPLLAATLRGCFTRRDSAREAVLLTEILGPPLALRLPAADAQFR